MKIMLALLMVITSGAWAVTPTVTPTVTPDIPDWLRALPTIPASQQVYTTPEKTPSAPKILPTPTFTPIGGE